MFYIKVSGQKKEITARNVYTLCPECGKCSRSKHNMSTVGNI